MNQEVALGILLDGQSVFLTGAAGAGKTYLLNEFVRRARARGKCVAITATTGLAATHLGGVTIHSWSGIGIMEELPRGFFDNLSKTKRQAIERADILIIDEISMLYAHLLDMIDQVCRIVRSDDTPFGGLQVVFAGDFAQLPPVSRSGEEEREFAYTASSWRDLSPTICYLSTQYRQEDTAFADILNAIRENKVRRAHAEALLSRVGAPLPESCTELHTTNANVDIVNSRRLRNLLTEERSWEMTHTGSANKVEALKRSVLAPEVLTLKVGATVMALKNDQSRRFVNGSVGEVIDISGTYPIVRFNNGREVEVVPDQWEMRSSERRQASVTQVPLRLAWAITVHKSQGMTLDAARLNLSRTFAPGMGYVALSRVRNLGSLSLLGIGKSALLVSKEAVAKNQEWTKESAENATRYAHLAIPLDSSTKSAKKSAKSTRRSKLTEEEKAEKAARSEAWANKLAKMREVYPKAFMPWELADDEELQELFLSGNTVGDIVEITGRHPGSIRARLKKNYGEEIFE